MLIENSLFSKLYHISESTSSSSDSIIRFKVIRAFSNFSIKKFMAPLHVPSKLSPNQQPEYPVNLHENVLVFLLTFNRAVKFIAITSNLYQMIRKWGFWGQYRINLAISYSSPNRWYIILHVWHTLVTKKSIDIYRGTFCWYALGVLDKHVDRNHIKLIKRGTERGYVFM